MATHDSERFLPDLLASLAAQSHPPHELVVHEDGSTDSTPELLERFRAEAPFPVRIDRGESNRGHVRAFRRAAELCEGDVVAFCDSDDVWDARKVELCVSELANSGATLLLHTTELVDADLQPLGQRWPLVGSTRTVPPLGLTGLDVDAPGMAMVVRAEVLEVGRDAERPRSRYFPDKPMLHDEWTIFLAGVLGSIRLLDEPLVRYRQHGANHSGGWVDRTRARTLRPVAEDYANAAAHLRSCERFLESAAAAHPASAERLAAGARHYGLSAECWEQRLALYRAPGRRARGRLLWRLLAARAYRRRASGGFGRAALAKDLAGGLVLGERAR